MSEEIDIIEDFMHYLRFERHLSPHTGNCYATDIWGFTKFVAGSENIETVGQKHEAKIKLLAVEHEDIERYLASLKERQFSKTTIQRKLATVRSFYKFCLRRGFVTSNPAMTAKSAPTTKRMVRP